jgi:hypothetical protein
MSGRGNFDVSFCYVCGIEYAPHTFRIRPVYVPHTLPHTLTHTSSQIEAPTRRLFLGVAMIRPLQKKALFQGVFEANSRR